MNTSQIFIFGVGRSGTTALYNLLQHILDDVCDSYSSVYEPFLWERDVFDKPLKKIVDEFSHVSSLSIDGIYANKQIPLLLNIDDADSYIDNLFVNSLVKPSGDNKMLLAKYIRANGRLPLLRKLAPDARFIYVMRNPLDVINSSINMFSFYGGDFHASDFERFVGEVTEAYPDDHLEIDLSSKEQREFLYWYYMNKNMADYYKYQPENSMPIVYENYLSDKSEYIKKICEFIGVEFKDDYVIESKRIVGESFSNINLTEDGYSYISSNLDSYAEFTEVFQGSFDKSKLLQKYDGKQFSNMIDDKYRGKTAPNLRRQLLKVNVKSNNFDAMGSVMRKVGSKMKNKFR